MINLNVLEQTDHLNIKRELAEQAKNEFKAAFSAPESERIRQALRAHRKRGFGTVSLYQAQSMRIVEGIASLLIGDDSPTPSDKFTYFEFFTYYFMLLWRHADTDDRNGLQGKLLQGIKDHRHLMAFFFEMVVGFSYRQKLFQVIFRDLTSGDERELTYDLDVGIEGDEYAVEVKTTELSTGLPFDKDIFSTELMPLASFVRSEKYHDFVLEVHHVGSRNPKPAELRGAVLDIIRQLSGSSSEARNGMLEVRVQPGDSDHFLEHVKNIALGLPRAKRYLLAFGPSKDMPSGFIGITSSHESRLSTTIKEHISKASKKQLPHDQRQVVWVQLLGSTFLQLKPHESLKAFIDENPNIVDEILKSLDRDGSQGGGIVSLHIVGDYTTAENDGVISLQFQYVNLHSGRTTEVSERYKSAVKVGGTDMPDFLMLRRRPETPAPDQAI